MEGLRGALGLATPAEREAERRAFGALLARVRAGYRPTRGEVECLQGCEAKAARRAALGAAGCGGAFWVLSAAAPAPATFALRGALAASAALAGGYVAATTSAAGCLRDLVALEGSPLAAEACATLRELAPGSPLLRGLPAPSAGEGHATEAEAPPAAAEALRARLEDEKAARAAAAASAERRRENDALLDGEAFFGSFFGGAEAGAASSQAQSGKPLFERRSDVRERERRAKVAAARERRLSEQANGSPMADSVRLVKRTNKFGDEVVEEQRLRAL